MAQQLRHGSVALVETDLVKALFDPTRAVLRLDLDLGRLLQEFGAGAADVVRVGRGKQQGLSPHRAGADDAADLFIKSHIGHPVGLVQHQRLHRRQIDGLTRDMVADPSRRADHDVGTMLERRDLRPHRRAAAQRQHLDIVGKARQPAQFVGDLIGQLARRAQHQPLDGKPVRIEPGQHADAEGGGLATAGLGLRDQVAPLQYQRQALRLDAGHLPVTELVEVGQQGRRQRQAVERARNGIGGGMGNRGGIHRGGPA